MIQVTVITVGTLKEGYWRDAMAEYEKRLCAFCKPQILQLKEARLGDDPTKGEIDAALSEEGKRILASVPPRAYKIALCVEGVQYDSPALAKIIERACDGTGKIALVIGSSHGLSDTVKRECDARVSFSKLTFPHQLMKVILSEALYRSFTILAGKRYHK